MQPVLYIRLTGGAVSATLRTLHVTEEGVPGTLADTALDELSVLAGGCRVVVIVPAADLLLTSATVPSRSRQRIVSAVPYLLEDQLASDVEQLHFVIGAADAAGRVATVVVEHQKMQQWLELLRTHHVEPHTVVADLCCLPQSDAPEWSLLLEGDTVLVSTGRNQGFVVDADNLMLMLRSTLQTREKGAGAPEQLRLISSGTGGDLALVEQLSELDLVVLREDESVDALHHLAQGFDKKQALNLLQGRYSRREQIGKLLRPWRAAAAMLAALLLFSGGMTVVDYFELSREKVALQQNIDQTYLAACPGARKVVNARAQMEQCLKKLRGGGVGPGGEGLLVMLSSIGDALKAANGLQLQRLSFRGGQLDMALAINDIQGLDQLKQRIIKDAGLQVEILSATSRNKRIEARLQLKGKDA